MRITEGRMISMAGAGLSKARERVAGSAEQLTSGVRVDRPSQDASAWASAQRAEARQQMNVGRGQAVATANEHLDATDRALSDLGTVLARARELAVEGATATMDADARAIIAAEIRTLRQAALAAANTRANDGEYIMAGSRGKEPAFDANGVFQGDDVTRSIETTEGQTGRVTVSGRALTSADGGVDIFQELAALETALDGNDAAGIAATIETLATAHQQVSTVRSQGGAMAASLLTAGDVQAELDISLNELRSRLLGADVIATATLLAQQSQTLEAAQAVVTRVLDLTRP